MDAKATGAATIDHPCVVTPLPAQESASQCGRRSRWAEGLNWPSVCWLTAIHIGALTAPVTFSWAGLLTLLLLGWLTGGIGICLGYHRLFTHRSFAVVRPLRWSIAVLGSLAGQGSLIDWVADHRKHHALALLTYGEGWHNNHHAFPRMARNRHKWWEVDLTFEVIRLLRSLGLARDVIEITGNRTPERARRRQ